MKKLIKILVLCTMFASCSKDNESSTSQDGGSTTTTLTTKATIFLNSVNGVVPGITVYAYDQDAWTVHGDNTLFANGQAASDSNGNAVFSNIEYTGSFTTSNNNQNTFRFSAHYSLNGVNKTKVKAVTFTKGQQKTETIILD